MENIHKRRILIIAMIIIIVTSYIGVSAPDSPYEEVLVQVEQTTEDMSSHAVIAETESQPQHDEGQIQDDIIPRYDIPLSYDLQKYIWNKCKENNVEYELIIAMISLESGFKANVISKNSDYGLMQINKINHKRLKEKLNINDFLNPYDNVTAGIHMISELKNNSCGKYKTTEQYLMAYNMGIGGADRCFRKGIYSISYSRKIISNVKALKEEKKL